MRGKQWCSWLGAALLGLFVVTMMPTRAEGSPGDKPAARAGGLEEARRLDAEVDRLRNAGRDDEALPLAERALRIREKALTPDHPEIAIALRTLAMVYVSKKEKARAEPLFQRYWSIREKLVGPAPETASPLLHDERFLEIIAVATKELSFREKVARSRLRSPNGARRSTPRTA